ncbi:hypothetical protein F7725_000521 [Dissostichus mawsoni]|uniref:Uncharacterized protein n=1 Tax=Dissostichus mawsoni TaxID=36200 RepID=A0A7J5ZF37_DISMA|nr:hypothetical protein F7725_000521 [Dissostichus mawsoni]
MVNANLDEDRDDEILFTVQAAELITVKARSNVTENQVEALKRDAEDKGGIRANNYNFAGAELHVQTHHYTPKLIALMKAKGGVLGTKLRPFLEKLSQEDSRSDATEHVLKILVVHGANGEDPVKKRLY